MKPFISYTCGVILLMSIACGESVKVLKTETIVITSPDEIVPLEDTVVQPLLYKNIPDLDRLPIAETKQKFIATILPAILIAKHHIAEDRKSIKALSLKERWTQEDSAFYKKQLERFKASNTEDLLIRMHTHPNSIILAQAAVESGWGSSRFFREANNLFGIWSYSPDEPRVSAKKNNVYLRRYDDISQSVEDYFETIGRSRPYRDFRQVRAKTNDIDVLLPHLRLYSQRKQAYIAQLKTIISQNNLTQYDNYQLDPRYFVEV